VRSGGRALSVARERADPRVGEAAGWLPLLSEIADGADRIALQFFRARDLKVDEKPDRSPVTEADRAIEATAARVLRARHAQLGVLGEEHGDQPGSAHARLIIDPIDGTQNFVRGIPVFATLLAIEEHGEVVAGLVSAPALATRWHAARGAGASRNGRPVRVSRVATLDEALLFHASLGQGDPAPPAGFLGLTRRVARTRGFGDFYQHALVAEGAGEAALDPAANAWDIAALQVIVEEAGGRATTLAGERSIYGGSLVTSNGVLHARVLEALAGGLPS
jgi:histidinol-phosphatase